MNKWINMFIWIKKKKHEIQSHNYLASRRQHRKLLPVNSRPNSPSSSQASFAAATRALAWAVVKSKDPSSSSTSSKASLLMRLRSLGSRPTAAGPRSRHCSPSHLPASLFQTKRNGNDSWNLHKTEGIGWRALNNNGYGQKMSQRYFCPAEYTAKTKPKTKQQQNNPNPKP